MIERKFVNQKFKEYSIQEFISENLKRVGHSHTKMIRTPLGEKIIVYTSRPGLIVGRKGQNIKKLTKTLKKKFELEDPQIEISEVSNIFLDAQIVAEKIANSLERYGTARFKGIGHKILSDVMGAGAAGIEVVISGKIPSARAKRWRFYQGYLKKCGNVAVDGVKVAYTTANLKTGVVGIQVRIMPSDLILPDKITIVEPQAIEEKKAEVKEEKENKEIKSESPDKAKKTRKRKPKKVKEAEASDEKQGDNAAE